MFKYFTNGITKNNPITVLMLGLCSVVALSTTVFNALGMGIAVIFVLTCSNFLIAIIRKAIPDTIRLPVFIIIISTFVTIIDYVLHAFLPELYSQLGVFVPLIVVNCIILGRAEAFASKNGVFASFLDGLGCGFGYLFIILAMGIIRELLGTGTIFGKLVLGTTFASSPVVYMILPPGGFLIIAFLMGITNFLKR